MVDHRIVIALRTLLHGAAVVIGSLFLTLLLFLVLPLLLTIGGPGGHDLLLRTMDVTQLPPPPPPPEPEPEREDDEEPPPPQLVEEAPPLDLSQIELSLQPSLSATWLGGDFAARIGSAAAIAQETEALFSMSDLDQEPRVIYQPAPVLTPDERRLTPGTVYVIFIVDQNGRVENPIVQRTSDPALDRPALAAVRQWKFEPGRRNGEPVRFRMRVPITFPRAQ